MLEALKYARLDANTRLQAVTDAFAWLIGEQVAGRTPDRGEASQFFFHVCRDRQARKKFSLHTSRQDAGIDEGTIESVELPN